MLGFPPIVFTRLQIEARICVVLTADAGATGDYTATILKFDAAHFHYFGDDQPGVQCLRG